MSEIADRYRRRADRFEATVAGVHAGALARSVAVHRVDRP